MDVERSSLCNCVVNFLLEENYLLSAFELLHELLDDGRDDQAIRLKEYFSDPSQFPPDQISRFNSLRVADPQSLLEEKESLEEKLAISEYELRLAREDLLKLRTETQKKIEISLDESHESKIDASANHEPDLQPQKDIAFSDLGPLKGTERQDLNCAVKEYLLLAGYRLTAMTFYEEVTNQNLDSWKNSSARVPDALRRYYYKYLLSTTEAAEERIGMLEPLLKENERLKNDNQSLLKSKGVSDAQAMALKKSLEVLQKEINDKEILVQDLKQTLESQRKELNGCRAEITSLKMQIEGACSGRNLLTSDSVQGESWSLENRSEEIQLLRNEIERLKAKHLVSTESVESIKQEKGSKETVDEVDKSEVNNILPSTVDASSADLLGTNTQVMGKCESDVTTSKPEKVTGEILTSSDENTILEKAENFLKHNGKPPSETGGLFSKSENLDAESNAQKGLGTVQILSDSLPKIVPYVLIQHREELLPLIMCAIERHPDSAMRDSLTHTLFNLIKRPDDHQRRIIMDACVTLAKNVGQLRTETELLPQCWEQINHIYEERRLLVAQSCGELAEFVRPEIRDSLILSIVQQLIEDSAVVVREAAAHNLALLLPLFPNTDKYFKVEEMMFQLVCDPSGVVVETTIKELVPALINWGSELDHVLQVLLSHILGSAQRCPPLSGVEGSVESQLRVLGERERWNVDVLLRLLVELLPFVHQKAVKTCPFSSEVADSTGISFTVSLFELYAGGFVEWPTFEWLHIECYPNLIRLASLLPQKEDNLRNRITKILLSITEQFGETYLTNIMLPVFLVAVGENADFKFFPSTVQSRIRGLKPQTLVAERLATMCVLPVLLAGVLGHPSKHEELTQYLRNLLVRSSGLEGQPAKHEIVNSVRFICLFEEHHSMIFNILWELVVSSDVNLKIRAAHFLKVIVPYIDAKVASTHVLPALVTLGSDQNLNVKYASIDAFGAVAMHFKSDVIVDKIRIQMDSFLEDGSVEATIAVIFQFTASPTPSNDLLRRRERANAFCESIRALDATDLPSSCVRDFLLPAIQNLLKDPDALDPAHKEALEIILRERSGGTFDTISKVMGAHIGLASSVTNFFGESGLLGRKESDELGALPPETIESPKPAPQPVLEDTRFRRIMRGGFTDMLRGKTKSNEENSPSH
ncbi:lisH domain and HEAT repeat-containing KIAA1468 homolog [Olea europaea subsp. europaea]|uniref:LisH domain and HEAT repeat-containing KIAA1468 homolog n=1 Tax=Olea europaea subsp. europaea TaxID=158383 RepID=A0A8S0RNX4_OLEEU|nr:lisH domain and HEAT repeat-containing KIAA1468 homolog [Olea europaea subsp. europaea]